MQTTSDPGSLKHSSITSPAKKWLLPEPRPPNAPLYLAFASRGRYTAAVSILRFDNDSFNASNFQFPAQVAFLGRIPALHLSHRAECCDLVANLDRSISEFGKGYFRQLDHCGFDCRHDFLLSFLLHRCGEFCHACLDLRHG